MKQKSRISETIKLLFISAIILRLMILVFFPMDMWHDASFSYLFSKEPISYIFSSQDVHPPLYYLYLKIFTTFTGDEYILRGSSIILFCFYFIALKNFLMKHYKDEKITLVVLAIISFSPTIIFYSLEPRNYLMGMLFVLLQFGYFFDIKDKKSKRMFILFSVLMLYTHYYTAFILVVEAIIIYFKAYKERFMAFLDSCIFISIFSIPLVFYLVKTLPKIEAFWFKDITMLSFFSTISFQLFLPDFLYKIHAILYVSLILGAIICFGKIMKNHKTMVLVFFFPVCIVWLISQFHQMYHHRFFLFYSFALYILIALIITYLADAKFDKHLKKLNIFYRCFGIFIWLILCLSFLVSMYGFTEDKIGSEIYKSQKFLKDYINEQDNYTFIHVTTFSSTPYHYYFRDYKNVKNLLNTDLTEKQLFTAGGSVVKKDELVDEEFIQNCHYNCFLITHKSPMYALYATKIYDEGGLYIYELN